MLTLDEIKFYLKDPSVPDSIIESTLARAKDEVATQTNNYRIDENGIFTNTLPDRSDLERVYLYLVLKQLNPDTRNSQGLDQESIQELSFTFQKDIPKDLRRILTSYNKAKTP